MTAKVKWLRVAAVEAREARCFYETEAAGLGDRFTGELKAPLRRIVAFPRAWPPVEPPVRRALVNRFPYLVHYVADEETIVVLGVYHSKRRPISWKGRLDRDV